MSAMLREISADPSLFASCCPLHAHATCQLPLPLLLPLSLLVQSACSFEDRHATLEHAVSVRVNQIGQLHLAAMRMVWIQKCCLRDQRLWGSAKSLRS